MSKGENNHADAVWKICCRESRAEAGSPVRGLLYQPSQGMVVSWTRGVANLWQEVDRLWICFLDLLIGSL